MLLLVPHNIRLHMLQKFFGYENSMEIRTLHASISKQDMVPTNRGFGEPFRILGRLSLSPIPAIATHKSIFPDLAKNEGTYAEKIVEMSMVMANPVTYHGGPLVGPVFSEDEENRINPMHSG